MRGPDLDFWWTLAGDWVEPPNDARSGWSGMLRTFVGDRFYYVKRQRNFLCRSLRHPFGWPTAVREWHALLRMRDLGLKVPVPVFFGMRRTPEGIEAAVVTEELTGFAPLSEQTGLAADARGALAHCIGRYLGTMHRARLQHGCLYDKHIMVRWVGGSPEIALIDLEKMRRRWSAGAAVQRDLEQLRRRQAVFDERAWTELLAGHAVTVRT